MKKTRSKEKIESNIRASFFFLQEEKLKEFYRTFQTTEREVAAAKTNIQMLIGEINTQENMFRTGRADNPHCIYCRNSENIKVIDTLKHIILTCPIISDNKKLKLARSNLEKLLKDVLNTESYTRLTSDQESFVAFCLNPTSFQVIHLNQYLNESELKDIVLGCQRYLQDIWSICKRL